METKNIEDQKDSKRKSKNSLSWKPDFKNLKPGPNYRIDLIKLVSWVDENVDKEKFLKTFKEWVSKYNENVANNLDKLKLWQLSDLMNYAYIEKNGGIFDESTKKYINNKLSELDKKFLKKEELKNKTKEDDEEDLSTRQKNMNKYMKYQAFLKQYIVHTGDDLEKARENIKKTVERMYNEKTPDYAIDMILEDLTEWAIWLLETKSRENKQKLDNLRYFSELLHQKKYNSKHLRDLDSFILKKRKEYKTTGKVTTSSLKSKRTKEISSKERSSSTKIRYKKESDYGFISLKPEKLIGAKFAFVFDDSLRILNLYVAEDQTGIFLSRSKVKGIDEEKSFSIKIRKPEETLEKITKIKENQILTLINKLKTKKQRVRPLLNERSVILKIFY